ncbi:MAG TPA: hypothetical protein VNI54_08845 [Thermoanaerobaculia bacterium]|nr:hypothetical protein [Thermoanaerobaculia bacterium]
MRTKPVIRELSALAFFIALAIALTWPLAAHLDTAVSDFGDPLLNAFILDWACYALTHQPLDAYDAPIFHPGILPFAYSENLFAVAVVVMPFFLAGMSPMAVYNVAFLLGFALSGYGAWVLARHVSGSTVGSLAGGIFYAFCSFKFDHLPHLQIVFSPWPPLMLVALLWFWERVTWKRGAFLAAMIVANSLTNIYFLLFCGVAMLFTVIALQIITPRRVRFYGALGATVLAAGLVMYPFLRPYQVVSNHYRYVRSFDQVRDGSATWRNWLVPTSVNRHYGPVPQGGMFAAEKQLFPGLGIVFLALMGVVAWRRTEGAPHPDPLPARAGRGDWGLNVLIFLGLAVGWAAAVSARYELTLFGARIFSADSSDIPLTVALVAAIIRFAPAMRAAAARSRFSPGAWAAAVWMVVGVFGSFGASNFLYIFFYRRFEPFQAMRVAARFAIVAYVGLAVWGALGAAAWLRDRKGWKRQAIAVAILAFMIWEVVPRIRWEHVPRETPPVYTWLNKTRVGPVVEIPFSGDGVDYRYVLYSAAHRVKLVNGTSGFFPTEWWKLRDADSRDAFDEMLGILEGYGARVMIVHGDSMSGERYVKVINFLKRNLASGRLQFLQRFDNEVVGDYVFAITRNLPQWQRYRTAEVPDGAGHVPSQALERFLSFQPTHSNSIMIVNEEPTWFFTAKGALRVKGWAMSPHGLRRVTVFLHSDKYRFDATHVPRPDVQTSYPWLRYLNDQPGFELTIPEKPKGIPYDTSLIVEVEDHAGRVRRGRHVSFQWEDADEPAK